MVFFRDIFVRSSIDCCFEPGREPGICTTSLLTVDSALVEEVNRRLAYSRSRDYPCGVGSCKLWPISLQLQQGLSMGGCSCKPWPTP